MQGIRITGQIFRSFGGLKGRDAYTLAVQEQEARIRFFEFHGYNFEPPDESVFWVSAEDVEKLIDSGAWPYVQNPQPEWPEGSTVEH